jgi:hypothetical protein
MSYVVKGRISDSQNNPLQGIPIKAYDHDPLGDDLLGTSQSNQLGYFEIPFTKQKFDSLGIEGEPDVYLVVIDSDKKFLSVKARLGGYRREDKLGNVTWTSIIIDDVSKIDRYEVTIRLVPLKIPEKYEAVVIGSGFGGTIVSLTLANMYSELHSDPRDMLPNANLPSFNVYPGSSQKQDIEILADGFQNITIEEISFVPCSSAIPDGLSFKIHDPINKTQEARFPYLYIGFADMYIQFTLNLTATNLLKPLKNRKTDRHSISISKLFFFTCSFLLTAIYLAIQVLNSEAMVV